MDVEFCQILFLYLFIWSWISWVVQTVKNLPEVWKTWVWFLGWEDPLEKGTATHSNILAWKISWTEEPGGLQSMGSQRVGHDWATYTFTLLCLFQERSPLSSLASPWNLWSQKGNESLPWCGPQPGGHKHLLHSLMHSQWRILTALFLNALVIILIMHLRSCTCCQRFAGELVGAYRSVTCKTILPPFPSR